MPKWEVIFGGISAASDLTSAILDVINYASLDKHELSVQKANVNFAKLLADLNTTLTVGLHDRFQSGSVPDASSSPGADISYSRLYNYQSSNLQNIAAILAKQMGLTLNKTETGDGPTIPLEEENWNKIKLFVYTSPIKYLAEQFYIETEDQNGAIIHTSLAQIMLNGGSGGSGEPLDLTNLINQLKLTVNGTEYTFIQVLFNLLKCQGPVNGDPNFSDNIGNSMLALGSSAISESVSVKAN